jgi:hypothetical protein
MIFALTRDTPEGERFEKVEPRQLLGRLLGIMEEATYKAPEVLALEIMAEVDLWECFDENDEAVRALMTSKGT